MFKLVEDEYGRKVERNEGETNRKDDENIELIKINDEDKPKRKMKRKEKDDDERMRSGRRKGMNEEGKWKRKNREEEEEERGGEDEHGDEAEQEEERELAALRIKMSTLPLAKLAELRTKLGTELFEKALYGTEKKTTIGNLKSKSTSAHPHSAKRPREECSARPPPKLRPIKGMEGVAKQRNTRFDPRFSAACGQFDEFSFHRDYAFLDDMRQRDIQELKKAYRNAKRQQKTTQADRIHRNLLRLEQQQKAARDQQLMERVRTELRQGNIERMNRGERPIYLNNNELKERFLERKRELYGDEHQQHNKSKKKEPEEGRTENGEE